MIDLNALDPRKQHDTRTKYGLRNFIKGYDGVYDVIIRDMSDVEYLRQGEVEIVIIISIWRYLFLNSRFNQNWRKAIVSGIQDVLPLTAKTAGTHQMHSIRGLESGSHLEITFVGGVWSKCHSSKSK